jgi:rhodanese-related sulfurtransferase
MDHAKMLLLISLCMAAGIAGGAIYDSLKPAEYNVGDYYATETQVLVSPHDLRVEMDSGSTNFTLVDVRAPSDYTAGHIIGAINIPITLSNAEILATFSALPKDKRIIVYCYSGYCMAGRSMGKFLSQNGIYVKELNVGWNEWRYYWNIWNTESEWNTTNVSDYIATGNEPGVFQPSSGGPSVCSIGEFKC